MSKVVKVAMDLRAITPQSLKPLRVVALAAVLLLLTHVPTAWAKIYIDIDSPAGKKLPLAIQEFVELDHAASPEKPVTAETTKDAPAESTPETQETEEAKAILLEALAGDLDFTGLFDIIEKEAFLEAPEAGVRLRDTKFEDWRLIGTEILIKGALRVSGEKLIVEFRLFDAVKETQLIAKRYIGRTANPRAVSHAFTDDLIEKLTGTKGIFSTKLAFVSDRTGAKEIYTSDYDGRNIRQITFNRTINLSPRWSPDGKRMIFTSYKNGRPNLYMLHIKSGRLETVSARTGINIGGRWSPDGKRIVLTLSGRRSPEIYTLELSSRKYKRLTDNFAIDVSPDWSPDGERLAFVSDRGGNPHIYMIDFIGGMPKRLSHGGKYNSEPAWSPDGRFIAFSRTEGSNFDIWVMRKDGTDMTRLTTQGNNTAPSWSPDGRYIIFSGESNSPRNESYLYIMRSDGSAIKKINTKGRGETAPSWSWYLK